MEIKFYEITLYCILNLSTHFYYCIAISGATLKNCPLAIISYTYLKRECVFVCYFQIEYLII